MPLRIVAEPPLSSTSAISVAGCSPGSTLPPLPAYDGARYHLGVGHQVVDIGVEDSERTFRSTIFVIELPLVGSFHAAGRSTGELRDALSAELELRRLLRSPSVSVEALEHRRIFVLDEPAGPVRRSAGGHQRRRRWLLRGGSPYRAVEDRVQAPRRPSWFRVTGRADLDADVAPADVITVLERYF